MPFRKHIKINHFVALMITLGIVFILVLGAFFLATSFPGALGSPPIQFEIKEIYEFEPWRFTLNDLEISFPRGGKIVPLYVEEKQKAALFWGFAEYHSPEPLPLNNPGGFFVAIDYEILEKQRGDILFMPVENTQQRITVRDILRRQLWLPVIWQGGVPISFFPHGEAVYYYFLDRQGNPVLPPLLDEDPLLVYMSALLYAMIFLVIVLVLYIFSLDHHFSVYWKNLFAYLPPRAALLAVPLMVALALGGELLPVYFDFPELTLASGYAGGLLLFFILARYRRIDSADLGVRRETLRYGYVMALGCIAMIFVVTWGIPREILFKGWPTVADFALLFLLVGLPRELIWRGFIQTTLSRRLGAAGGLFVTVLMAGGVHLLLLLVRSPWLLAYPYAFIEAAVLVPGLALVLGFLYLRTENIISCALLHALLIFLPRILVI